MSRKKKLAVAFAYLVIDGFMTFEEVYDWLKELTKQALITLGRGDLAGVPEEGEN